MIKTKNLIILGAVLLILFGISMLQKAKHEKATSSSATALLFDGELNAENIGRVSIGYGTGDDTVVLVNGPDGWIVESYFNTQANQQRVDSLLRGFSNLAGEFRSDNQSVLGDYGLLDDQAITVRGRDLSGTEVFAVKLGQSPEGFAGNFMRLADSNKVYLSQAGMLSHMGIYGDPEKPKNQHFLELQVVQENSQDIDWMTIVDGEQILVFSKQFSLVEPAEGAAEGTEATTDRTTWEWLLDGKVATELAKTKIDGVLNSGVRIRANDVADPAVSAEQYGLDNPSRKLTLNRHDGSQLVLEFGSSREASDGVTAGTYMRTSNDTSIWLVTEYTTKNIFKSLDELKAE